MISVMLLLGMRGIGLGAFIRGLRDMGYEFTIGFDGVRPVRLATVMHLLDAPDRQLWSNLDICPRTCPSQNATLCTYARWFARPARAQTGPLLMQPLSARCMRMLLRFRLGCHSLPVVLGRRDRVPRDQRLCRGCDLHAVGDERHMVFECPALQTVRDRYPTLFAPAHSTMQLFLWQPDLVRVAHFIMDCFDAIGVAPDMPDDASDASD